MGVPAYNAFISYSHTTDGSVAAALQSALHRFATPWYKLRGLRIFRDQTNLAVNPALWSSIRAALDQSQYFILLASPEAAASPWVSKETEYWLGKNGTSRVLVVLTGGALQWDRPASSFATERTNALPANLLRAFSEEPLFLDLAWTRGGGARLRMREPRFHEAVLQLAATLHDRPKDELDGEDVRHRRQARLLATSGVCAILVTTLFALRQTQEDRDESQRNFAATLAASSAKVLADNPDRAREAALLAIESNHLNPSFEANQALRAALSLLPAGVEAYAPEDRNPAQRVRDVAFSPDGTALGLARDDGSVEVLDILQRKPPSYLAPDEQPAAHIELTGNPHNVSSATADDAAVSVAFNSTGTMLAAGARDGLVHVWALRDGRELLRVAHGAPVSQVTFQPKVDRLATADDDGHVRIFDVTQPKLIVDVRFPDKIVAASFSPGGELLAALSAEGVVYLLDPAQGKLVRKLVGGETGFNLAFSGDGARLVAATGDFASAWDVATGRQLVRATHAVSSETLTPQQWIYASAITADGKFLAYAARGNNVAHVWNVDTGRQILDLKHASAVAAVSFSADGTKLGTGSYDGTARVWEFPSGSELARVSLAGGAEVVAFSPDGSRFAAGGVDGSISVSAPRRADRPVAFDLPGEVRSVAFSQDGRRFAIGTVSARASPLVRIADIDGRILRDIEFHGAPVIDKLLFSDADDIIAQWSDKLFRIAVDESSVSPMPPLKGEMRFDGSGKMLAVQQDQVSRLYDLPGLQQTNSLDGASSGLLGLAREGRLAAFQTAAGNKWYVDIWSVADKTRVSRIALPGELTCRIAFNSAGTVLFTAQNENLQAWDVPSGKRRFSIVAGGDIDVIVPDPGSVSFATVTHGQLAVWDAATGTRLAQLPDAGYLRAAAFSPDGRYLLAGYHEGYAALWLWRSADLRDRACSLLPGNLSHAEWARWFPNRAYRPICPNLPPG